MNRPPRVLLISYFFPPTGGAGIGRPLGLFRHLPQQGVDCEILTVKPIAYHTHEPELLDGLDQSKIHRARSCDPLRLMRLVGRRQLPSLPRGSGHPANRRMFPDAQRGWIKPAVRLGLRLQKRSAFDVLISTSPPISAHLVAHDIHNATGIPWVADFRDYWTSYTIDQWYAGSRCRQRAKSLLRTIRSRAAAMVAVNRTIAEYLGGDTVILNGFDSDLARYWQPPRPSRDLVIGVLGTIDRLRPIQPLFELLRHTYDAADSNNPPRIRIVQVGRAGETDLKERVRKSGLKLAVEYHGPLPRRETIAVLAKANAMYLGVDSPDAKGLTTSRIYDLLVSGRPIVAYAPDDSELASLVRTTKAGVVFGDSKASMTAAVQLLKSIGENPETVIHGATPESVLPYSREQMAVHYANLIKRLAATGG